MWKLTNILPQLLVLDILEPNHIREHHNAARLAEPLAVLAPLRVLVPVHDLAHLRRVRRRTDCRAGRGDVTLALAFALVALPLAAVLALCNLLNGERVHDARAVHPEPLALLMAPLCHEARSEVVWVRS